VHFNYLGSDVLLSTIYRALETNAKVYKLSGCAETFSLMLNGDINIFTIYIQQRQGCATS
jgi:hypothetical protein